MARVTNTVSGAVASFKTPGKVPIRSLKAYFSPKQEGTGDPAPDNVRPITGWTGCNIYKTGKNLYNPAEAVQNRFINENGEASTDILWLSGFIFLKRGQTYYRPKTGSPRNGYYDFNKQFKSYVSFQETSFTPMEDCYFRFCGSKQYYPSDSNIQLELGSAATEFEPFNQTVIPIGWETEAGTIYGGYVDLSTGDICKSFDIADMGELTWNFTNGRFYASIPDILVGDGNTYLSPCVCDTYKTITYRQMTSSAMIGVSVNNSAFIRVYDPNYTTIADFVNAVDGHMLAYPLQTPVIVATLDPVTLSTLRGQNNIWSNADDVEVEYDFAESAEILTTRRKLWVNNAPHIETASGGLVTVNTDVAAPLKSCKVEFAPVQEGTGDPSPENVRLITGWTGLEVYKTGKNLIDAYSSSEILEKWPRDGASFAKYFYGLPTDQDLVLQANITKDLGENDSTCRLYIYGLGVSGRFINTARPIGVQTMTNKPDENGVIRVGHNHFGLDGTNPAKFNRVQLELGTVATDYEPYNGVTIPIDWETEAGTIYGGYVDLVTGEVWKTFGHQIVSTSNTTVRTAGSGNYYPYFMRTSLAGLLNGDNITSPIICDSLSYGSIAGSAAGFTRPSNTQPNIYWVTPECSTSEDAEALRSCGYVFVYKLDTPVLLDTLSPTVLKTLRGMNNIWSNTNGDVTIKYWKH